MGAAGLSPVLDSQIRRVSGWQHHQSQVFSIYFQLVEKTGNDVNQYVNGYTIYIVIRCFDRNSARHVGENLDRWMKAKTSILIDHLCIDKIHLLAQFSCALEPAL